MLVFGIHHVQVAMPCGKEAEARDFYGQLLGLVELQKPPVLAARGGVWFQCGGQELHLGVEEPFYPARKAHPASLVSDYEALIARLRAANVEVTADTTIPGVRRAFVSDPFSNRIELLCCAVLCCAVL
jgi:catechol 2,3-dioxygenase-like lactoylglutathione lyase family enzyme